MKPRSPRHDWLIVQGRLLVLRWYLAMITIRMDRDQRPPHLDELDTLEWHIDRLEQAITKIREHHAK